MSASLASKPLTLSQRVAEAQRCAAEALHSDDTKRATAALLETALEEMRRNPGFALRVHGRFDELAPARQPRARQAKTIKKPYKELIPIKQIEGQTFDVSAALDPYFLLDLYGADQLTEALDQHPTSNVREAVEMVQERHPGTKPQGRSKSALIAYVVRYVTQ